MTASISPRSARAATVAVASAAVVGAMLTGAPPAQAAPCVASLSTSGGFTRVAFNTVGGACEWTVPAGVFVAEILIVGGGGGGGGGGTNIAGGGGGGGQVRVLTNQALTPGATLSVTVGGGGAGGSAGGAFPGGNGGSSSIVIGTSTVTSAGGVGGGSSSFAPANPQGGANGGGNAGGSAAQFYFGDPFNANGGGGGGAAAAANGRNGGAGITWQGSSQQFGSGGGGGSFYQQRTSSSYAQGLGGSGAGNGGYNDTTWGELCSYGGAANFGGGGGGAFTDNGGSPCFGSGGGSGTVKLRYAVPQTVTFNANGGTGSIAAQQANTTRPLTTNCTNPSDQNTCAIKRPGYTFAGWATTPGGTMASGYAEGASYSFASSVTLYAVWAAIIYDANGGTGTMSNTTGTPGSSVTLSTNGFSPAGSPTPTFKGWDTNPNASPASPLYPASSSPWPPTITMPSGVVTLYAIWDPPIVTSVSYDANGGGGSEATQSGVVGSPLTLSSGTNLSWTGYTLASWNTAANGSGTTYALGQAITIPSGGLVLYAKWNAIPRITYDANGGTGSVADQTAAAGSSLTLASGGGLDGGGNTFLGWSTDPNATSPTYTAGQSIIMPAGGLALYAIWNPPIVRSVLYNANGGTGSEALQSDVVGDPVTLAAGTGMSYAGRTLLGWDANPAASSPTYTLGQDITMPTNGLALYAIWSAPEVPPVPLWTLGYDPNGGTCSKTSDQAYDTAWLSLPDASACSREGYEFTGWNTSPNGSGLAFPPGGNTQMTGNNTLYAQWRKVVPPLSPATPSPTPTPAPSDSPSASPSASPTASPSVSPSVSPSASPAPAPAPSGSPGSNASGPIPDPVPSPSSDGVVVTPKSGVITQPDGGSVDPLEGGRPSDGASFSGGSIAIWDGTQWTQSYTDPGVGSWLVIGGRVRFVPVPGFIGTASTTMRVIDNAGKVGYAPVSFTVLPPAEPAPAPLPERGSAGLGPIPAPPALPAGESGVVVQPQGKALTGPSGTVDPLDGAIPSNGASIDPGSLVVWDGAGWVTSYDDARVGTWRVVDGKVVFTPAPGFCGTASTTMRLTDTLGKSGTAPVAFAVPCAAPGSNGSGIVPGPPNPPFDGTTGPWVNVLSLSGFANADGGVINAATALAAYGPDLSTLRIWNGRAWVTSFTDPGVGTWQIIGGRILFTPAKGFTGVARTTFRAIAGDGTVLQGPVTFTVPRGCDAPTSQTIVIGFDPNDATVSRADRARLARTLSRGCTYVVTGWVQPVGTTANDRSLSLNRAEGVAQVIRETAPAVPVRTFAGGRWRQVPCVTDDNRCAIVRPSRAIGD